MATVQLLAGAAQSGESSKAIQACNDYLRMGPGRSLAELHRQYTDHDSGTRLDPPTEVYTTLRNWSSRYDWAARAAQWDAEAEERKTAAYEMAMGTGLALDYERVNSLKKLAGFLEGQIYEQGEGGAFHNVWVPDVKVVGHGDSAEVVDIERFNAGLIDQFRRTLDDLAKETGGRVAKTELTGKDGGALTFRVVYDTEEAGE